MLSLMTNDITHKIREVSNNSDQYMSRLLVTFNNGYALSIIRGSFSYGASQGLFEIAVYDPEDEFCTNRLNMVRFDENLCDDVKGWQTEEEVKQWAIFVANL